MHLARLLTLILFLTANVALANVEEVLEEAERMFRQAPKKAIDYLDSNQTLFEQATDLEKARWLLFKVQKNDFFEEYTQEREHLLALRKIVTRLTDPMTWALYLRYEAYMMVYNGRLDQAVHLANSAFNYVPQEGAESAMAEAYLSLAYVYVEQGVYSEALINLEKARKLLDDVSDKQIHTQVYIDIGFAHLEMEKHKIAKDYFLQALALAYETGNNLQLVEVLYNLATSERYLQNFQDALSYYQKQAEVALVLEELSERFYAYYGLAQVNHSLQRYKSSNDFAIKALAVFEGSAEFQFELYKTMASNYAYMKKIDAARDALAKASEIYRKVPEISSSIWSPELVKIQALIAEQEGDFEKALKLYRDYSEAQIQSLQQERADKIASMADVFGRKQEINEKQMWARENRIQQKEIEEQTLQNQTQRAYIIALVLFAFLSILSVIFWENRRRASVINQKLENEVLQKTKELNEAKEQAEAANRAKTDFLANMSHEIRTPLNAIIGITEIISQSSIEDEHKRSLSKVMSAANLLLSVLNDVLDFSKIEANKIELESTQFDLKEIAENITSMYSEKSRNKDVEVRLEVDDTFHPWVEGDPVRVQQIIMNLVSNAYKFTEKGSVSIHLNTVNSKELGDIYLIQVVDTGIGIPKNKLDKLFNAFVQADVSTNRQYGGTGLGLAICKKLAQIMGGDIEVQSQVGLGSTFNVYLPLKSVLETDIQSEQEESPQDHEVLENVVVLVVEDNAVNRQVVNAHLKKHNFNVFQAENGVMALEQIEQHPEIDIVLMDMQMPVMDGIECTKQVRQVLDMRDLPIIALTANAYDDDRKRCLEVGMNDFLAKPFTNEQLFTVITKWVREYRATKRAA